MTSNISNSTNLRGLQEQLQNRPDLPFRTDHSGKNLQGSGSLRSRMVSAVRSAFARIGIGASKATRHERALSAFQGMIRARFGDTAAAQLRGQLNAKSTRGDVARILEGIRRSDAMNTTAANNVMNEFSGIRMLTPRPGTPRTQELNDIGFPEKPTPAQKHNFVTTYDTALRGSVGHAVSEKGTSFTSSVFASSPKAAVPHTNLATRIASGFVNNDAEVKALNQNLTSATSHLTGMGEQLASGKAQPFQLAESLVLHNAELTNAVDRVMQNSKGQIAVNDRAEVRNALMHSVVQRANSELTSILSKSDSLPAGVDNIIKNNQATLASVFQAAQKATQKETSGWKPEAPTDAYTNQQNSKAERISGRSLSYMLDNLAHTMGSRDGMVIPSWMNAARSEGTPNPDDPDAKELARLAEPHQADANLPFSTSELTNDDVFPNL